MKEYLYWSQCTKKKKTEKGKEKSLQNPGGAGLGTEERRTENRVATPHLVVRLGARGMWQYRTGICWRGCLIRFVHVQTQQSKGCCKAGGDALAARCASGQGEPAGSAETRDWKGRQRWGSLRERDMGKCASQLLAPPSEASNSGSQARGSVSKRHLAEGSSEQCSLRTCTHLQLSSLFITEHSHRPLRLRNQPYKLFTRAVPWRYRHGSNRPMWSSL